MYIYSGERELESENQGSMMKEPLIIKKCSHCGQNGHNSRTCNNGKFCSFKLFGVTIDPNTDQSHGKEKEDDVNGNGGSIRKCKSMESLQTWKNESSSVDRGYLSDGLPYGSNNRRDKKKGMPWSEDEHRSFLVGLKELGKGDWRGISRNYVTSRTPTQVASHAQKYFIRKNAMLEKRKRRSSLFDMPFKESSSSTKSSLVPSNKTSNPPPLQPKAPAFVRPPVSPVAPTYGIQDFRYTPYMMGYPFSNDQRSNGPNCSPAVLMPVPSYPNNHVTGEPLVAQPHGSAQATSVTKKDGMEVSIGALSL